MKASQWAKNVGISVIGGIGLLIASVVLNAFISSPPSRAEFVGLKTLIEADLKHIRSELKEIKQRLPK